jgi:hypothetical protein
MRIISSFISISTHNKYTRKQVTTPQSRSSVSVSLSGETRHSFTVFVTLQIQTYLTNEHMHVENTQIHHA